MNSRPCLHCKCSSALTWGAHRSGRACQHTHLWQPTIAHVPIASYLPHLALHLPSCSRYIQRMAWQSTNAGASGTCLRALGRGCRTQPPPGLVAKLSASLPVIRVQRLCPPLRSLQTAAAGGPAHRPTYTPAASLRLSAPATPAALCRASATGLRPRAQGALAELLVARAAAQAADTGERACARAWQREAEERLAGAEEVCCCTAACAKP
jgi:hypothetical protein